MASVCHANSDYTILCGLFKLNLKAFGRENYGLYIGPHAIASRESGVPMARALGKNNVVLLTGHGAAVVSTRGPEDCVQRTMNLEEVCKITWMAFSAVGKDYEKYAIPESVSQMGPNVRMADRWNTPGKDMTKDQCYYNAAMVKTYRKAVEG